MSDYLTEQEQVELLKSWVKQYSFVILLGMLMAAACIFSWRYWQQRQYKILSHASSVYDEMLTKRAQNDQAATLVQAEKLLAHYPKSTYGQFSALMLARDAINKKDYAAAEKQIRWVINRSHIAAIRQIARIRLARLYLTEAKPEAALETLSNVEDKTFNGLIEEVRGDAHLAMHQTVAARDAYQQALKDLPNAESVRPLLQMKYDNLVSQS